MYWAYQWLPVLILAVQTALCYHSQLPRSRGGIIKQFSSVLKILESPLKREYHENMQGRKSKIILQQLKLLIDKLAKEKEAETNVISPIEGPLASDEDIEDDDPYDKDGIFYITKPKSDVGELLKKVLNKSAITKYASSRETKDIFTKEERDKLDEILLGESVDSKGYLRNLEEGAISQPGGAVYRFDDLVA